MRYLLLASLAASLAGATPGDAARAQEPAAAGADTVRPPRAVQVSPWHARRLAIHRTTAWTIPPLFVAQALIGRQLYDGIRSVDGPAGWVRPAHRTGAALIGTAFAINATTGLWNLWADRHEPEGRVIRILHGTTMLAAAGGFTYAGIRLSEQAKTSNLKRDQHRNVALASMGLTLASGAMMWWVNR